MNIAQPAVTFGFITLSVPLIHPFPPYLSGVHGKPQSTWVVLGGKAHLPCDIQPEDPLEMVATVLWYKGAQGEPIYT